VKIALVGSAPSSIGLAPFHDPEWKKWGVSPGAHPLLKKLDAFFEIHRWTPNERGFTPEFIAWMAALGCPVYLNEKRDDIPTSVAYPAAEILAMWPGLAQSFFTSSLAWMLALAIMEIERNPVVEMQGTSAELGRGGDYQMAGRGKFEGKGEIGLWGVDMAADEEYWHQKPGCHFFMLEAERRGIKVTVPPQSDLARPIPLYGIGETSPMRIKIGVRRQELMGRLAEQEARAARADQEFQAATRDKFFVLGALDDLRYFEQTWTD
jgi:sarcosine oxidase delta subunit